MKASRLDIPDTSSRFRKAFHRKPPEIGGNNFFTGEYDAATGSFAIGTRDQAEWESFWRGTLKQEPPGPLPRGALALMSAEHHTGDPVELQPQSLLRHNNDLTIRWQRVHTATPGQPVGKSRYAVLIVPKGRCGQYFEDVFRAEEQRALSERIAAQEKEALKVFTEGTTAPVVTLPKLRFKK